MTSSSYVIFGIVIIYSSAETIFASNETSSSSSADKGNPTTAPSKHNDFFLGTVHPDSKLHKITHDNDSNRQPIKEKNTTEELLQTILNNIKLKSDSRLRPKLGRDPVVVYTDMYILDIGDISEAKMQFRVSFFYRMYWRDERLSYEETGYKKRLALNAKMVEDMWIPDIYFVNEKDGTKHDLTKQNEVVRVWPDGKVFHSIRLSMTASCPMRLHNYPMDKQICSLSFESFSYPVNELNFKWRKDGGNKEVMVSDKLEIPQFILTEFSTSSELANFTTGSYSRLTVIFKFERSIGFFLIQTYIPAYLIVMLSWIAFWIHYTSTPARIGLGITTVLTMTTLTNSARASLPKVSYVKSIEWFLIMCFTYVFMSLVEFGCVSYEVKTKIQKGVQAVNEVENNEHDQDPDKENALFLADKESGRVNNGECRQLSKLPMRIRQRFGTPPPDHKLVKQRSFSKKEIEAMEPVVDRYARIIFPVSFVCLNITYWIMTYNASQAV
ncbi:glycine receptor subunit alpha-2 isoform X2 [Exaiptasia diaphana]|uniref:Gamma-aminobutyric acid receptor subunit beta n=1 Tax=Exaiptasia diaphana TaxID=2652724 RepID=A0A913XFQ8_EXADI|nr:glycine receptor subunit alpha-2 isoform X2 [Exaiptasia diaphana]